MSYTETLTGEVRGMPAQAYHDSPGVSSTALRSVLKCDQLARHREMYPLNTKALTFGEAVHTAVLEPATYRRRYGLMTESGNTKAGREQKAGFLRLNKEVLSKGDAEACDGIAISVRQHPAAGRLLDTKQGDVRVESSFYGKHEPTGLVTRCRCDLIATGGDNDRIVDLKTTEDASEESFMRSVVKYGYHIQAAYYRGIVEQVLGVRLPFYFVAVEKKAPYLVQVFELDEEAMRIGFDEAQYALKLYDDYRGKPAGPMHDGYSAAINKLSLPLWYGEKKEAADV